MENRYFYLIWFMLLILFSLLPQTLSIFANDNGELENILSTVDSYFIGESSGDRAGSSISGVGDVNNDGFDDFIIGATGYSYGGGYPEGKVYLLLGRQKRWNGQISLSTASTSFLGEKEGNMAGTTISGVGDVNNDGYDDFIIGVPYDANYESTCEQSYLIFGRPTEKWTMDISLSKVNVSFIRDDIDHFGTKGNTLAGVGDVNNDGFDDIVIGVSQEDDDRFTQNRLDPNFKNFAGYTYLYFGRSNQKWKLNMSRSEANASFVGESDSDYSGAALAGVGDVNNDGFADFVIGAWGNNEGADDAGKTYLILGKETSRWQKDTSLTEANASFIGEGFDDYAGWYLDGIGDINNDDFDDILIAAPGNREGLAASNARAGRAYLYFGKTAEEWTRGVFLKNADILFTGTPYYDYFSGGMRTVGVEDVNNDGYDDFIISSSMVNARTGSSYLFLGKPGDWSSHHIQLGQDENISFIGENEGDKTAVVAGIGDIDNDNFADFCIASPEFSSNRGKIYLYYGSEIISQTSQKTSWFFNLFNILSIVLIGSLLKRNKRSFSSKK